ncbi:serine/threonine protein kinase [Alkalicoccobacillus porphyridii]|uniref:Protein kinase family protein n=1 Tax=Alkalicoccobacillus porphyridii TaxID=2597270 RepID=A0A553ZU91_9BACI|nr:protein kinase family protein [Alkalicoccobacillus porphyridii]TSB45032.1 protein kinase family protein [Alkalicoccobacillus porphyridii]
MRNHSSTKRPIKCTPGTILTGKWHQHNYTIIRLLGEGATGVVYLAQTTKGLVAVKVGIDSMAITTEVNVLRQFSKQNSVSLGPELLDVDDILFSGHTYPFYVMEYLSGEPFITFMNGKGPEWLGLLIMQLLGDLERLHHKGWVFGDLKPDNLLVSGPPTRVRWLDVGGTTLLGRSIKEYTEFFDRGYWTLGSRKADPAYDLFSVAMAMINCAYPRRFDKKSGDALKQLRTVIKGHALTKAFEPILVKALTGRYASASEMKYDLTRYMQQYQSEVQTQSTQSRLKQTRVQKRRSGYKVELILSGFLVLVGCLVYVFIITM